MAYALLKYIIFLLSFAMCFYALSGVQFEKFMKVKEPKKSVVLLFILSVVFGSILSQTILDLTILNGFGL